MSGVRSGLLVVAIASMVAFTAITFLWIWRDMAWRKRPTWLRVLVLALTAAVSQ